MVDRQQVVVAVEKYLAQRGISVQARPNAPARAAGASTSDVVDRFLAAKRPGASQPAPAGGTASGCGVCAVPESAQARASTPQQPPVALADFVCENDVREAVRQNRKIFIGPKTIVTPSARDLGGQYDVLVIAQRSDGGR
jgi:hypothetical protein